MADLMSTRWLDAVRRSARTTARTPFAVNIGCWDGKSFNDPVYPLYAQGFAGVAIEWGNPAELQENLGGFEGVRLLPDTYVTPYSVCRELAAAGCPLSPDFLKIDIDGMDGDVLGAVLRGGYRPQALQVEVNPEIPPPYAFNVIASTQFRPGGHTGFFGMSLQYACDLLAPFGYRLVELDFTTEYTHDALFLPAPVIADLPEYEVVDPRQAYLAAPEVLPHIQDVPLPDKRAWRTRPPGHAVLEEVWAAMLAAGLRKHGHTNAPFTLYLSHGRPDHT